MGLKLDKEAGWDHINVAQNDDCVVKPVITAVTVIHDTLLCVFVREETVVRCGQWVVEGVMGHRDAESHLSALHTQRQWKHVRARDGD